MTPRALVTLLTLGGVWGASFLFIKVVVEETSPLDLVAGRLFFGALAIALVMALRRVRGRWRPSLLAKVSLMAVLSNVVPFALIAWAEVHIASGTASVLNSTMPLFTALFAAAFPRPPPRSAEPLPLSGLQLLAGTVLAIPLMLAVDGPPSYSLSVEAWLSLITRGVMGSGLAYVAYLWLGE